MASASAGTARRMVTMTVVVPENLSYLESILGGDDPGIALAVPGAADRPGRAGLHRPAPRWRGGHAAPAPGAAARRPAPDGLGQRPRAGALHAGLQPAGGLPARPDRPGRRQAAARALRVLGARGVADPGRAAAGPALADGARSPVGRHRP